LDRNREGAAPDVEGVNRIRNVLAENWDGLNRIQGPERMEAFPERQAAGLEEWHRVSVRRVRCPERKDAGPAARNREGVKRIRFPVQRERSPVKPDREAVRRIRSAENAARVSH
jgi:hypothetical protein